ncbi:MAG: hypothetical protein H6613_11870 [Ignavibacteriales bacterium]|nr:hypothetical protein [Ignavibacteriales bacterium]
MERIHLKILIIPNKIIENKITELIDESERMDNFDIWEDYLEGKRNYKHT